MDSSFGAYINPDVITQLERRSAILKKGNRTDNDLAFLFSRSSWVRIISTTNNIVEDAYSNTLSKKYILAGGSAYVGNLTSQNGSEVYRSNLKSGINFSNTQDISKVYNKTDLFGIKPFPGITDFKISHKNRGTLRVADFTIKVWSLEDFEAIETLYLRLGFPLIIEYGHSVYVDNDGTVIKNAIPTIPKEFFEVTFRDNIVDIIKTRRDNYDYNYDAFIGIVKNFTWSFNAEGGYDVTLSVITEGEVIESLTTEVDVNKYRDYLYKPETTEGKSIYRSELHLLKYVLDGLPIINDTGRYTKVKYESVQEYYPELAESSSLELIPNDDRNYFFQKRDYFCFLLPAQDVESFFGIDIPFDSSRVSFFSLRNFLEIINVTFIKKFGDKFPVFDIEDKSTFLTFENHVSIDPMTAFLPFAPRDTRIESATVFKPIGGKFPSDNLQVNASDYGMTFVRQNLPFGALLGLDSDTEEHIGNIQVGLESALSTLEDLLNSDADVEDKNVLTFMRMFLRKIERAFGNINEFDIAYDEDRNKYIIYDQKVAPVKGRNDSLRGVTIPTLELTGKQGLATSLNIESKITNKIAAQISIAAQADTLGYPKDYSGFTNWNRDLRSRLLSAGRSTQTPGEALQNIETTNNRQQVGVPAAVIQPVFVPLERNEVITVDFMNALRTKESGNRLIAISEDGAEGPYQILPSTAVSPGFLVTPLIIYEPNNLDIIKEAGRLGDAARGEYLGDIGVNYENETFDNVLAGRFAREYIYAMYLRYEGDAVKILAAYNWGFGNVDNAIALGGDFYSRLPVETKKYVIDLAPFLEDAIGKSPTPYPERFEDDIPPTRPVARRSFRATKDLLEQNKSIRILTNIREFYEDFNGAIANAGNYWRYDSSKVRALSSSVKTFFNTAAIANARSNGLPGNGPIPLELTFTIDGVSGIKIFNSFKIKDTIVPSHYKNYGFIIKGIEHSITPNRWETTIMAQTYFIPGTEDYRSQETRELDVRRADEQLRLLFPSLSEIEAQARLEEDVNLRNGSFNSSNLVFPEETILLEGTE